jgi:hypothetical protein
VDSGPENSFPQGRPQNNAFLPGESPRSASKIRSEADQVKRPPKKSPGELMSKTGRNLMEVKYHGAAFLAKMFEKPFRFWEQRRSQLQDRISNEGSAQ